MARADARIVSAIEKKTGLSRSQVNRKIAQAARDNHLTTPLAAILVGGEYDVPVQRFATAEQLGELRGVTKSPAIPVAASAPAPRSQRVAKQAKPKQPKDNSVFVAYGRDEELRKSMFDFLRALNLKPYEWAHVLNQVKRGNPDIKTAIEITMAKATAVVVLFSPDDEARLAERLCSREEKRTEAKLAGQPRPNVLYEAGLAMGAHPEKTLLVQVGKLRGLSDISGLHMARLNNDKERRNDIANRLQRIGCKVDRVGTDWMSAGDFTR